MKYFIASIFFCLGCAAHAGEFFEKNGYALDGFDPVSYLDDQGPRPGIKNIFAIYKESKFLFADEVNRAKFLESPEKFAPQFNGFCAFGTASGYKAKTDANAYTVVNGKLYLNYNLDIRKKWLENRDNLIKKGEENWPSVLLTHKVYQ